MLRILCWVMMLVALGLSARVASAQEPGRSAASAVPADTTSTDSRVRELEAAVVDLETQNSVLIRRLKETEKEPGPAQHGRPQHEALVAKLNQVSSEFDRVLAELQALSRR